MQTYVRFSAATVNKGVCGGGVCARARVCYSMKCVFYPKMHQNALGGRAPPQIP